MLYHLRTFSFGGFEADTHTLTAQSTVDAEMTKGIPLRGHGAIYTSPNIVNAVS